MKPAHGRVRTAFLTVSPCPSRCGPVGVPTREPWVERRSGTAIRQNMDPTARRPAGRLPGSRADRGATAFARAALLRCHRGHDPARRIPLPTRFSPKGAVTCRAAAPAGVRANRRSVGQANPELALRASRAAKLSQNRLAVRSCLSVLPRLPLQLQLRLGLRLFCFGPGFCF